VLVTITDILHIFENGHNFATALPIDVLVGSRVPGWGFGLNVDFFLGVALLSRVYLAIARLSCNVIAVSK